MFSHFMSMHTGSFESGFSWWGPVHIGWLAVIITASVILCVKFRRIGLVDHDTVRQDRWLKVISLILIGLEILKDSLLISVHAFNIGFLPLHLCGLSMFVYLIYAFTKSEKLRSHLGEIAYGMCMICTCGALLFPDWTAYYPSSFRCILAFLIHGLLLLFPLLIFTGGRHRPWIRRFPAVVIYIAVVSFPMYFFDRAFDVNYMFLLHGTKGTPIAALEDSFGSPTYIFIYLGLLLLISFGFYIPFILDDRREGGHIRQRLKERFD
ncbi:MAG: YwaF family protein [Eubacteriaceae bacterium]|nr:YwaF family protein [Eubacteriaceae bacterium]